MSQSSWRQAQEAGRSRNAEIGGKGRRAQDDASVSASEAVAAQRTGRDLNGSASFGISVGVQRFESIAASRDEPIPWGVAPRHSS